MFLKEFWKKINLEKQQKNVQELESIINYESKNNILIEVKDLSKVYKQGKRKVKKVFENINLNIYENEIIALIGPNGAGKTTLVEIISQIKKQTSGTIKFHYQSDDEKENIGVQFQDLAFPRGLTVKDFIDFQIMLSKNNISSEFLNEMLATFQLAEFLNYKVSKLSGGQQQRLNVLIAMMNKPKVLFLDEFTTGLDIAIKNEIKNFILKYAKDNNITIVLISHDIDIIDQMAQRFVLITNNKIVVDTDKENIEKKFKSVSNFLFNYIK